MHLTYGIAQSPFGRVLLGIHDNQIAFLGFIQDHQELLSTIKRDIIVKTAQRNDELIHHRIRNIFHSKQSFVYNDLYISTSVFSQRVLKALMSIPRGQTCSYKDIATMIGSPQACQAVGRAIASNPCAYIIPCHRVIKANGSLGGFKWGVSCKEKLLEHEGIILG